MEIDKYLSAAVMSGATDVFLVPGAPLSHRMGGGRLNTQGDKITPQRVLELISDIYRLAGREMTRLDKSGDDDFAFAVGTLSRFRCNVYRQRGSLAAVIRVIPFGIPDFRKLHIPDAVMDTAGLSSGLVLVTGPASSGKSTTLACLIDRINATRSGHIITLEEPIEFLHKNKRSIVSQREIGLDSKSFSTAMRACLRQCPDVILVGELRDRETTATCMTAVETGHLVISTLHTLGAANVIDRLIDVFPPQQQPQIRLQAAMLLKTVISQQLVFALDGSVIPVFEIMPVSGAIRNMIRESKTHQIDSAIATGSGEGMRSMDADLLEKHKAGLISRETAIRHAINPDLMAKRLAAG